MNLLKVALALTTSFGILNASFALDIGRVPTLSEIKGEVAAAKLSASLELIQPKLTAFALGVERQNALCLGKVSYEFDFYDEAEGSTVRIVYSPDPQNGCLLTQTTQRLAGRSSVRRGFDLAALQKEPRAVLEELAVEYPRFKWNGVVQFTAPVNYTFMGSCGSNFGFNPLEVEGDTGTLISPSQVTASCR